MTRLATFWLGLFLGAAGIVVIAVLLRMTPHVRLTLDQSPTRVAVTRSVPMAPTKPRGVLASMLPAMTMSAPTRAIMAPAAPALLLHAMTPDQAMSPDLAKTNGESSPSLLIPVAGVKAADLVDSFADPRGDGRTHQAIDIMASRGTPVLAVSDGKLVKLFTSRQGGLTIYQFDPSQTHAYYYAHLDAYAPGLQEGNELKRGDVIGSVGSTGNANADAPHLHFAVFILGPERHWWQGDAIDPYPLLTK